MVELGRSLLALLVGVGTVLVAGCSSGEAATPRPAEPGQDPQLKAPGTPVAYSKIFAPLPARFADPGNPTSPAKVELGRMLFHDPRLSVDGRMSCATCHDLANYGVDNQRLSPTRDGKTTARNTPTVYNSGAYSSQFWDGRAPTLEAQAIGPILNPDEMGLPDAKAAERILSGIPEYREAFARAFPEDEQPIRLSNVGKALAVFERELVSPSRFDRYLQGDMDALTAKERAGLDAFVLLGCATCHNGPALGGTRFAVFGQMLAVDDLEDVGRGEVTGSPTDRGAFKVPSLRNVARTAPYFHDGRTAELREAVRVMAHHQLARDLNDFEEGVLLAFLGSLTGELPADVGPPPGIPVASARPGPTPEPPAP